MNADSDMRLMVAVPYDVVLRTLRELDPYDRHQRAAAESLLDCLPSLVLARRRAPRSYVRDPKSRP